MIFCKTIFVLSIGLLRLLMGLQSSFIKLMKLVIISLLTILATTISSQQCANLHTPSTLTDNCNSTTKQCQFSSLSTTSLIQNGSLQQNQTYILCLDLPLYTLTIQPTVNDDFMESIYLHAQNIFISKYNISSKGGIVVLADNFTLLEGSRMAADLLWIYGEEEVVIDDCQMWNKSYAVSGCSCEQMQSEECEEWNFWLPYLYEDGNFSMELLNMTYQNWDLNMSAFLATSNNSLTIKSSSVNISSIFLYAPDIIIHNFILKTNGLGFPSTNGYGCGYFDEDLNQLLSCSGTGGSHDGFGWNSSPQNCNLLMSRKPYGRQQFPRYPGSGGGFFLAEVGQWSAGGGVLNIQAQDIEVSNCNITSNGIDGIQGGGGGAGGALGIDYFSINSTGNIIVSAVGGNRKSSGSGGRLRLWNHNWVNSPNTYHNMSISVYGGKKCGSNLNLQCGQKGSIITSPCPPGHMLHPEYLVCELCPTGFYQISYSYARCEPCEIKPQNSIYKSLESNLSLQQLMNYNLVCNYICEQGYQRKGDVCITSLQAAIGTIGGVNFIICVGIIVVVVVAYLFILLIRKISNRDRLLLVDSHDMDETTYRSNFKIQDIPFHQFRIYLSGNNSLDRPWNIQHQCLEILFKNSSIAAKQKQKLQKLFEQINLISNYKTITKVLINLAKVIYYPISFYFEDLLRDTKTKMIQKTIISANKSFGYEEAHLSLKFHTDPYRSIGCVQLFNHTKQSLDFYIKKKMPLYFKLEKIIMGGYSIDFSDPLLKAFISDFNSFNQKIKFQELIYKLNQKLRNSKQAVQILEHMWLINKQVPIIQCYLWQPGTTIGVDQHYQINEDLDLFLVISSEQIQQTHFFYSQELGSIFYDYINVMKFQYNLKKNMQIDDKKSVFWEIQNAFNVKYLAWMLGVLTILSLLISLGIFFLVIFLIVENNKENTSLFLAGIIIYFLLLPFCQFLTVFAIFSAIVSKQSKTMAYAIYFALSCFLKYVILFTICLVNGISVDFQMVTLETLFLVMIAYMFITIGEMVILCMLNVHFIKAK